MLIPIVPLEALPDSERYIAFNTSIAKAGFSMFRPIDYKEKS